MCHSCATQSLIGTELWISCSTSTPHSWAKTTPHHHSNSKTTFLRKLTSTFLKEILFRGTAELFFFSFTAGVGPRTFGVHRVIYSTHKGFLVFKGRLLKSHVFLKKQWDAWIYVNGKHSFVVFSTWLRHSNCFIQQSSFKHLFFFFLLHIHSPINNSEKNLRVAR